MENVLAFISFVIVGTFTPGPNNIMALNNANKVGFKKGFKFNLAVLLGTFIIFFICAIFSYELTAYIPKISLIFKLIGAVYLLYLAYKTLKSTYDKTDGYKPISFKVALSIQFLNVKAILYGITAMSNFVVPYYKLSGIILFCLLLSFTCFASTCLWALFGSYFQNIFIKQTKLINIILALLLVYCAISVFI